MAEREVPAPADRVALSTTSRPRLASKARIRLDRRTEQHFLLYPERGLALNPTALAIVRLCTGEHTVAAIVDRLGATYEAAPREALERDVLSFLALLADRGLVDLGS